MRTMTLWFVVGSEVDSVELGGEGGDHLSLVACQDIDRLCSVSVQGDHN